jgi:DNA-binding protein HU-beta
MLYFCWDELDPINNFFKHVGFNLTPKHINLRFYHISKILNHITVTKAEIVTKIAEKTGIDKADVYTTVEAFFTVVKNSMADGENIYVRGFGSFINKKRAKKVGRNISKNTAMNIDEHYIPSFKPSKIFVQKNKNSEKLKADIKR